MRILTIGSFDVLHHGHLRLFERCESLGSLHIGINSDRFVREYKTIEPAQNEQERMEAIVSANPWPKTANGYWSVYLNDGPGADLIRRIKPDMLVIGSDWENNGYMAQIGMDDEEFFGQLGCSLLYVPRTPGVSSTQIREQRAGEAAL